MLAHCMMASKKYVLFDCKAKPVRMSVNVDCHLYLFDFQVMGANVIISVDYHMLFLVKWNCLNCTCTVTCLYINQWELLM